MSYCTWQGGNEFCLMVHICGPILVKFDTSLQCILGCGSFVKICAVTAVQYVRMQMNF